MTTGANWHLQIGSGFKNVLCAAEHVTDVLTMLSLKSIILNFFGYKKHSMLDLWILVQTTAPVNKNKNTSTIKMLILANPSLQKYML